MARKTHHVVLSSAGGWEVRKSGSSRSSVIHTNTKQEAIDAGRKLARQESSDFVIHGRNGQILRVPSAAPGSLSESEVRSVIRSISKGSGEDPAQASATGEEVLTDKLQKK